MNSRTIAPPVLAFALVLGIVAAPATASPFGGGALISPRVPISAFGLAHKWIDPSRLHVTSTMSMGSSGWGARGMSALQVTTLSYSFEAPVSMSVSVGNAWGANTARGGQSFFLEGFHLNYRPSSSLQFQVHYQNLRSPLQYQPYWSGGPNRLGY